MAEQSAKNARIASVVAATGIALACGTNYAYSAWGPDFAKRMELSATESNIIGAAGNVGAYAMGVPAGILIDNRGTRIAVLVGAISLACGYFPIHTAFEGGPGYMSVSLISFCSFLTGAGSCTAFSAAIKTAAYNWPNHRGTATAFPLSGFGLSAFFFTTIGHVFLGSSTSDFLSLLAIGTVVLIVASFFFLRLIPSSPSQSGYQSVSDSNRTNRTPSADSNKLRKRSGSGLDDPSRFDDPDDDTLDEVFDLPPHHHLGPQTEITGLALLRTFDFWQLFMMLGLLAGVGLMTINNIGNDAGCLWRAYAPETPRDFIRMREQMHVGILSLMSFTGRFISGIGSDVLIKRLHASRFWCLVFSGVIFTIAQTFALIVSDPHWLFLVSGLTGLAYGALFGVFPALVADTFGVSGLSLNWGFMIFAPVVTGNIYNVMYGRIMDANTVSGANEEGECMLGLNCYVNAYWLALASSIAGVVGAVWCVRYERMKKSRRWNAGRPA